MSKAKSISRSDAIREYLSANPKAGPAAVVAALKEKAIEVKVGLVSNVKHQMMSRKAGRRRGAQKEKPAMTGTQTIQAYLKEHPNAGPKEIQAALAGQGINVSKSLVSAVKYRKQRRRAPTIRIAARSTKPARNGITVEQLLELKRFVEGFGGTEHLRLGLETLARFA